MSESNAVASAVCSLAASGTATNEAWTVGGDALEIVRSLDSQDRPDRLAVPSSGYSLRHAYADDGNVESISNALAVVEYAYTPDRLDAGHSLTLSNGVVFTRSLLRDGFRRSLVTGIASSVNGAAVEDLAYVHDALGRPVARNGDAFSYNARGEVVFATVGGNAEAHGYDTIGNSVIAAFNGVTNACTANGLNQYASIACASASPCETAVEYDLDGNMTRCGDWTYTYDAANRLKTVSSNGVLLATDFYDAKGRRVRKVTAESTTTFFYDGWNLIEERVANANGTAPTIHYYWGKDLSGTLQGAGGVGGVLYLTVDGAIYIPCYDNNGNVTRYLDANGTTVAQYVYDAFGRTISQTGPFAHVFRHRFSTKYFDAKTGLYYYGHRFYSPVLRRWLNRDPIEEDGGLNLYGFCGNNAVAKVDALGMDVIVIKHLPGESPPFGWVETAGERCLALTVYRSPTYEVSEMKYPGGKIMFKVEIVPPNSFVDVYFRSLGDYMTKMKHEADHVSVARRHERAIHEFKRVVEAIHDCPTPARMAKEKAEMRLFEKVRELKTENESYDAPGGAHVL